MALVVCRRCQRHVKRADSVCPFCGAPMPTTLRPALGGALVLGMGLAMASCGGDPNAANAYGPPPCNGAPCGMNQACVQYMSWSPTRCEPLEDGGCPAGLEYADSCSDPSSGATRAPGCVDPPVVTRSADLAGGCGSDLCSCVCDGGAACNHGPYVMCTLS
jgi:hypothetical protein